jgi:hypothetical protein
MLMMISSGNDTALPNKPKDGTLLRKSIIIRHIGVVSIVLFIISTQYQNHCANYVPHRSMHP